VKFQPSSKKQGAFEITTTEPYRVWCLKADLEEDMNKWLNGCIMHSKFSIPDPQAVPGATAPTAAAKPSAPAQTQKAGLKPKTKEGYLEKLNGGVSGMINSLRKSVSTKKYEMQWKARYFVLKDGILFKYENKTDPKPTKFALYHCKLDEYRTDEDELHTQFQITTKQRTMVLRAENEQHMHEWLNEIMKHKIFVEKVIDDIEI